MILGVYNWWKWKGEGVALIFLLLNVFLELNYYFLITCTLLWGSIELLKCTWNTFNDIRLTGKGIRQEEKIRIMKHQLPGQDHQIVLHSMYWKGRNIHIIILNQVLFLLFYLIKDITIHDVNWHGKHTYLNQ